MISDILETSIASSMESMMIFETFRGCATFSITIATIVFALPIQNRNFNVEFYD